MGEAKMNKEDSDGNRFLSARHELEEKAKTLNANVFQKYLESQKKLNDDKVKNTTKAKKILEDDSLEFISTIPLNDIKKPGKGHFISEAFVDLLGIDNSFRKERNIIVSCLGNGVLWTSSRTSKDISTHENGDFIQLSDNEFSYSMIIASGDNQFFCCVGKQVVSLYYQNYLCEESAKHIKFEKVIDLNLATSKICLSRDDTMLIISYSQSLICVDLRTSEIHEISKAISCSGVGFSNNNSELIVADGNQLYAYDLITWTKRLLYQANRNILSFSISPNNGDIAVLSGENILHIYSEKNPDPNNEILVERVDPPNSIPWKSWRKVIFSPNGNKLLLYTDEGIWVMPNLKEIPTGFTICATKRTNKHSQQSYGKKITLQRLLFRTSTDIVATQNNPVTGSISILQQALPKGPTELKFQGREILGCKVADVGEGYRFAFGTAFVYSNFLQVTDLLRELKKEMREAGFELDTDDGLNFTIEWRLMDSIDL
jgi:hypothetical protein